MTLPKQREPDRPLSDRERWLVLAAYVAGEGRRPSDFDDPDARNFHAELLMLGLVTHAAAMADNMPHALAGTDPGIDVFSDLLAEWRGPILDQLEASRDRKRGNGAS